MGDVSVAKLQSNFEIFIARITKHVVSKQGSGFVTDSNTTKSKNVTLTFQRIVKLLQY